QTGPERFGIAGSAFVDASIGNRGVALPFLRGREAPVFLEQRVNLRHESPKMLVDVVFDDESHEADGKNAYAGGKTSTVPGGGGVFFLKIATPSNPPSRPKMTSMTMLTTIPTRRNAVPPANRCTYSRASGGTSGL